jgi:hypothetical protein
VNSGFAEWKGYAFGALATVSIIPLTLLVMGRTSSRLLATSREEVKKGFLEDMDVRI